MNRVLSLTVSVWFIVIATHAVAEEPKKETKAENQLVGTWRLVSAKYNGEEFKIPEGQTMLKHVTPTQFIWVWYDKDGKITTAAGGACDIRGNEYEEVPEYGLGEAFQGIKGSKQSFTWKIEKNKWHHSGKLSIGVTVDEIWEPVHKR